MRTLIVGVDGGGTKTALVAADAATGRAVARAVAGGLHALSLGTDAALASLRAGLAGLRLRADDRILAIAVGDPALDDDGPPPRGGGPLADAIRDAGILPAGAKLFVRSDAFMALYALSRGRPAALVVAGTGSIGLALVRPFRPGRAPKTAVVGGWCGPLPDPGGGHAIGAEGIAAGLDALDGTGPATALAARALAFFGAAEPRALVPLLGAAPRDRVAAFAREVDAAADGGDAVAAAILDRAGAALGRLGVALLARLGGDAPLVGYSGGILTRCERVRRIFRRAVLAARPDAVVRRPTLSPESGAALFAADALGLSRNAPR